MVSFKRFVCENSCAVASPDTKQAASLRPKKLDVKRFSEYYICAFPGRIKNMKTRLFRVNALIATIFMSVAATVAQTDVSATDKFVISAKAGGVNAVIGDVTVERSGGRMGRLFKGDEIQVGERVVTGADGKAEILMNPGSYVRLGANTSFEFESTDLEDIRIKMHSGSAIFEVFGAEDFRVALSAGKSNFSLIDTGVYRVDVGSNGNAALSVWRGKAQAGSDNTASSGKRIEALGDAYTVAKFDRDEKDELTLWSRDRAKELTKLSASLKRDTLRDPLINSFRGGRWNLYDSFGLWVYNPFFRSYCFLPFGYGWYSPYGHYWSRPIWYYNLPPAIYNQPPPKDSAFRGRNPQVPAGTAPTTGRAKTPDASGGKVREVNPGRSIDPRPRIDPRPKIDIPRSEPPTRVMGPVIQPPARGAKKP